MTPPHRPPTALLGERGDRLCLAVAEGLPLERACRAAGVSYDTVRAWLLKGNDPGSRSRRNAPADYRREPYWSFARRLRAAQERGRTQTPAGPRYGRLPADIPPEARDALIDSLGRGWTYHEACRVAGVRLTTFLSWLRLGGYPRRLTYARPLDPAYVVEPYRGFVEAVVRAEAAALAQTTS